MPINQSTLHQWHCIYVVRRDSRVVTSMSDVRCDGTRQMCHTRASNDTEHECMIMIIVRALRHGGYPGRGLSRPVTWRVPNPGRSIVLKHARRHFGR